MSLAVWHWCRRLQPAVGNARAMPRSSNQVAGLVGTVRVVWLHDLEPWPPLQTGCSSRASRRSLAALTSRMTPTPGRPCRPAAGAELRGGAGDGAGHAARGAADAAVQRHNDADAGGAAEAATEGCVPLSGQFRVCAFCLMSGDERRGAGQGHGWVRRVQWLLQWLLADLDAYHLGVACAERAQARPWMLAMLLPAVAAGFRLRAVDAPLPRCRCAPQCLPSVSVFCLQAYEGLQTADRLRQEYLFVPAKVRVPFCLLSSDLQCRLTEPRPSGAQQPRRQQGAAAYAVATATATTAPAGAAASAPRHPGMLHAVASRRASCAGQRGVPGAPAWPARGS